MRLVNRTFDELKPGDTAELRRLITADDLFVFAVASGNYNPMHLTETDLDADGQTERVAPGMFVASLISAVLGTQLPGPGTIFVSQSVQFLAPVRIGDTVEAVVEILELNRERNRMKFAAWCVNQNDVKVLTADGTVMPPKKQRDQ